MWCGRRRASQQNLPSGPGSALPPALLPGVSFVLVHDKAKDGDGGHVNMAIQTTSQVLKNAGIQLQVRDDPGADKSPRECAVNTNSGDCYSYNSDTLEGTAATAIGEGGPALALCSCSSSPCPTFVRLLFPNLGTLLHGRPCAGPHAAERLEL